MVTRGNLKSGKQLLVALTSHKNLPEFIPKLDPRALNGLIKEVGIADSAELIELATPTQFVSIIDDSVWASPKPGMPERFVPTEFLHWLEVIMEVSDEFAAERLASMDEDLLAAAMDYFLTVQDLNLRVVDASDIKQSGQVEALAGMDAENLLAVDRFEVMPNYEDEWAVVEPVLNALRDYQPELLNALLSRASMEASILASSRDSTQSEMDAAHNREQRQESEGYVSSQRAGVFLEAARYRTIEELLAMNEYDLDTALYFTREQRRVDASHTGESLRTESLQRDFDELVRIVETLENRRAGAKFLSYDGAKNRTRLERALAAMSEKQSSQRLKELSYLSNLLVAGETLNGEKMLGDDAAKVVMATVSLAHELYPQLSLSEEPGLVRLFQLGWRLIQQIQKSTVMALRQVLRADVNLGAANQWVRAEILSELNRPQVDADLELRAYRAVQDTLDMLSLAFNAETAQKMKSLVNDIPHWRQDRGQRCFIDSAETLHQASEFVARLNDQ